MRELLLLTHRMPYPPDKGDKIRSWHLLRHLSKNYRVHLGCFIDDPSDRQYIGQLDTLCASACFIDLSPRLARLRSLGGLLTGQPLSLPYYGSAALRRWVDALLGEGRLYAGLAYSGPMAQYLHGAWQPLRRIADLVDVDSAKWAAYGGTRRGPAAWLYRREARRLLAYERAIAAEFDATSFISADEAALFCQYAPESAARIGFFGNGVDTAYFCPDGPYADPYPPGGPVMLFTGAMDYWPNIQAVQWFALQVLPALRRRWPSLRFCIAGARPVGAVCKLTALPGISVTGSVPDMRPYLAHATLSIAPLQIARGVQNKVLEAMAMQKTVLATPQALQGIGAQVQREVLCASGAAQFINAIAAFLQHGPDLGRAARERILMDFTWDASLARLDALLDGAGPPARPAQADLVSLRVPA